MEHAGGHARRTGAGDRILFFGRSVQPSVKPSPVTITPANAAALGLTAEQVGNALFGETFHTALAKLTFQPNPRNPASSGTPIHQRFASQWLRRPDRRRPQRALHRSHVRHRRPAGDDGVAEPAQRASRRVQQALAAARARNDPAPDAALINVTGVANFGGDPLSVTSSVEASTQVVDNVSYTRGLHFIKAGIDYQTTTFDNVAG